VARKKSRKTRPDRRPVRPASPHAGPAHLRQTAFGFYQGEMVEVSPPAWANAQAFWDVWEATSELVTLSQHNGAARSSGCPTQIAQLVPDPPLGGVANEGRSRGRPSAHAITGTAPMTARRFLVATMLAVCALGARSRQPARR
jgi:hypothetical protein